MRTFHACIALALAVMMISCSSQPQRAPHPTVGILDLKQPKRGWFSSAKSQRTLVVKAVDGAATSDPQARLGLVLAPGWRSITLSTKRDSAAALGERYGGQSGRKLGERFDSKSSARYDRILRVCVLPGHDYLAHVKLHDNQFEYWIEDVDGDIIVAGTRR